MYVEISRVPSTARREYNYIARCYRNYKCARTCDPDAIYRLLTIVPMFSSSAAPELSMRDRDWPAYTYSIYCIINRRVLHAAHSQFNCACIQRAC